MISILFAAFYSFEYFSRKKAKEIYTINNDRIIKKLEAAKPYGLFMTTVFESLPTYHEYLTIYFSELLNICLGEIDCSLQINFLVDLGWVLDHYKRTGNIDKPLLIFYGFDFPLFIMDTETRPIKKLPKLCIKKISNGTDFGIHHTKIMIFCYKDDSVRVVVTTANLFMLDWTSVSQGVWISPKCLKIEAMDIDAGESPTGFKRSLINYLSSYNENTLQLYIDKVKQCDFSHINVFLIASIPGPMINTVENGPLYGHPRLGHVLRKYSTPIDDTWPIICLSSSIGYLGRKYMGSYETSWVKNYFFRSLRQDSREEYNFVGYNPEFKLIYPSNNNAKQSYDGGGCLRYNKAIHATQPWINQFLYQWKSESRHRDQAMPHYKCYCRFKEDKLAWFCLTSANLSRSAWGSSNKRGFWINNHECGVLFLPKFVIGEKFFSVADFPMPFSVPLTKYNPNDEPHFAVDSINDDVEDISNAACR